MCDSELFSAAEEEVGRVVLVHTWNIEEGCEIVVVPEALLGFWREGDR